MRYVSIQQTTRYSICKISDIACGPPFWTVLVSWYPHHASLDAMLMYKTIQNQSSKTKACPGVMTSRASSADQEYHVAKTSF